MSLTERLFAWFAETSKAYQALLFTGSFSGRKSRRKVFGPAGTQSLRRARKAIAETHAGVFKKPGALFLDGDGNLPAERRGRGQSRRQEKEGERNRGTVELPEA